MQNELPRHVAIIMDGNRRWAAQQGLPSHEGHEEGAARIHDIIREHFKQGMTHLTVWAASVDNLLKRSPTEVKFLGELLKKEAKDMLDSREFMENRIRVRFIGRGREIIGDAELDAAIRDVEEKTSGFKGKNFTILFGYDGREEMLAAIRELEKDPVQNLDYETLRERLWTGVLPPVDLAIRTGGEPHWSAGFMMWHTAESQFYFTETLWPAFTKEEYAKALEEYSRRERRRGK